MSTTIVETSSPVWVYKLSSENPMKRPNSASKRTVDGCSGDSCEQHCPKNGFGLTQTSFDSVALDDKTSTMSIIRNALQKIREPLVSYQESRGLPDSDHTFVGVMTALFQATYQAALTILTMLMNLSPLFDGFLYLGIFLLDKAIDICDTEDIKEKILKLLIFIGEFIVIVLVVMVMFCLILIPIFHLLSYVLCRVWNILFGSHS